MIENEKNLNVLLKLIEIFNIINNKLNIMNFKGSIIWYSIKKWVSLNTLDNETFVNAICFETWELIRLIFDHKFKNILGFKCNLLSKHWYCSHYKSPLDENWFKTFCQANLYINEIKK